MAALAGSSSFFLALLFLVAISASSAETQQQLTEIKMSLYFQDVSSGPNATTIPVAGIATKHWTFTQFGTIFITDEPITETPDPNSAPVGRAQGLFATTGLDGLNAHVMVSIVFTNEAYGGSTLQIQGASKQFEGVREVSIVSGTGLFRCNISVLYYSQCGLQSQFSFHQI
ncbi:hypothetical protein GH714_017547 [Hevea brasiliensis]|uniref:Dirigent protein n=1 Tax=Hevea brasiliensis TaxID=3981 RepID=A0A6A6KUA9_HEVBR|nr:hypothetical protein GH714_017547 [Hevea brasiliensis]